MFALSEVTNEIPMELELPESTDGIAGNLAKADHEHLLNYLLSRLKTAVTARNERIYRYARIDKSVSTWMQLTKEEQDDAKTEAITGRGRAIPINLPLLATHLDDMASYFSDIFAPLRQNFYESPTSKTKDSSKNLVEAMNKDARSRQYYMGVNSFFRSILKYNTAGFHLKWESGGGVGHMQEPGNRVEALDMYNTLWDPTVINVHQIPKEAEWAAFVEHKNHASIVRRGLKGELAYIHELTKDMLNRPVLNTSTIGKAYQALFYVMPPTTAGISMDGHDGGPSTGINWASYGASLPGEGTCSISGHEQVTMYCHVNPQQFNLVAEEAVPDDADLDESGAYLQLWKFIILDGKYVASATPVPTLGGTDGVIPIYLGHLTHDDMREAQRSVMELMKPFQSFGSFLMNTYQAGARKAIWGMTAYDPSMFDSSKFEEGDVVGLMASKVPGRDVRTGLTALDGRTGTENSMVMLQQLMQLVQLFFPSQALPSQVAQIDRAVKDQVAAVTQGSVRRLHSACRVIDDMVFQPLRVAQYLNIAREQGDMLKGLTEEDVGLVIGSGLQQMNAEVIVNQLKELIFAILQNQEATMTFDIAGLFNDLGRAMNMPIDLGDRVRQPDESTQLQANQAAAVAGAEGGGAVPPLQ